MARRALYIVENALCCFTPTGRPRSKLFGDMRIAASVQSPCARSSSERVCSSSRLPTRYIRQRGRSIGLVWVPPELHADVGRATAIQRQWLVDTMPQSRTRCFATGGDHTEREVASHESVMRSHTRFQGRRPQAARNRSRRDRRDQRFARGCPPGQLRTPPAGLSFAL